MFLLAAFVALAGMLGMAGSSKAETHTITVDNGRLTMGFVFLNNKILPGRVPGGWIRTSATPRAAARSPSKPWLRPPRSPRRISTSRSSGSRVPTAGGAADPDEVRSQRGPDRHLGRRDG